MSNNFSSDISEFANKQLPDFNTENFKEHITKYIEILDKFEKEIGEIITRYEPLNNEIKNIIGEDNFKKLEEIVELLISQGSNRNTPVIQSKIQPSKLIISDFIKNKLINNDFDNEAYNKLIAKKNEIKEMIKQGNIINNRLRKNNNRRDIWEKYTGIDDWFANEKKTDDFNERHNKNERIINGSIIVDKSLMKYLEMIEFIENIKNEQAANDIKNENNASTKFNYVVDKYGNDVKYEVDQPHKRTTLSKDSGGKRTRRKNRNNRKSKKSLRKFLRKSKKHISYKK